MSEKEVIGTILDLGAIEARWPKHMSASRGDDVHALIAEVRQLRNRVRRLTHGRTIEGDEACEHELEAVNLRAEVERLRSVPRVRPMHEGVITMTSDPFRGGDE